MKTISQVIIRRMYRLGQTVSLIKGRLKDLYLANKVAFEESSFIERQIYSGFLSRRDENLLAAFHKVDSEDRRPLVQSFVDKRCKELCERFIFFHAPESIPEENCKIWDRKTREKFYTADPSCEWLIFPKAINHAKTMIAANNGEKKALLEGHLQYYKNL